MIAKISYRDQIREYLQAQMLKGNLEAGQTISLAGLARELDVSVTPIREALTQLEQSKIITAIPNRGFVISAIDAKEANDIYQLIATLEALALENSEFSEKDLNDLEKAKNKFNLAKTPIQKIKADLSFHYILTRNYNNPFARQIIKDLKTRIFFYEKSYMEDADFADKSDDQHAEIIDLLRNQENEQAAHLLKKNWLIILEFIKKHIEKKEVL